MGIIDAFLGTGMQHSLTDTVNDIVTNLASGIVGGIGVPIPGGVGRRVRFQPGARRLERRFVRGFRKNRL